jgi:hypothetical protein
MAKNAPIKGQSNLFSFFKKAPTPISEKPVEKQHNVHTVEILEKTNVNVTNHNVIINETY